MKECIQKKDPLPQEGETGSTGDVSERDIYFTDTEVDVAIHAEMHVTKSDGLVPILNPFRRRSTYTNRMSIQQ